MTGKITQEEINQLIKEGKLKNTVFNHHYQQISACSQIIENCLTKLEEMGFQPFEVYYALREHVYYARFAFEDADREAELKIIEDEILTRMVVHRKKHPKEQMQKLTAKHMEESER